MEAGHQASRCRARSSDDAPVPSSPTPAHRTRYGMAYLPSSSPPPGSTPLLGRVAKVEALSPHFEVIPEVLPRCLVGLFGGAVEDYRVARRDSSSFAVFFPSWVTRGSAVGRSPLRFDDMVFSFSDWVESGEVARGRLAHKAWIRLFDWPLLCWSEAEVKAAVSGFGQLWEIDDRSLELEDVSNFRICLRCQDVSLIPDSLNLTVDDRRFRIHIEVESFEEAAPILLGEDLDSHLGLDNAKAQEDFIRCTGFSDIPGADGLPFEQSSLRSAKGVNPEASVGLPRASEAWSDLDFPPLQGLASYTAPQVLAPPEAVPEPPP